MRKISTNFLKQFTSGVYRPILDYVLHDSTLDMEIRDDYINIYYKGNSILKLNEDQSIDIHKKFLKGTQINNLSLRALKNSNEVASFINDIPVLKENVLSTKSKRPTLEIEFEQLLIRSNNLIKKVNSDIFITDRQYSDSTNKTRFDLTGFFWKKNGRNKYQEVPLAFIEIKYSLNNDIKNLDQQLDKYYTSVHSGIKTIAQETEIIKNQKVELGLFNQPNDRLNAIKSLRISDNIDKALFIIVFIDYDPHSKLFDVKLLKKLPFHKQIRIFYAGLSIWDKYLQTI